jgi:cell division protein FtsA
MSKISVTLSIDIGSNKICCILGKYDEKENLFKIFESGISVCNGIKVGAIIDINEVSIVISDLIKKIQKSKEYNITDIIVSLRGNFIKLKHSKGMININNSNKGVSYEIIKNVIDNVKKQTIIESDQEILQIIPKEYILNKQKGIQNPLGMSGRYIEVDANVFIIPISNLCNIMKAVNYIDIKCNAKLYSYISVAEILISNEEKDEGSLIVDFGGLTIGIVHYVNGSISTVHELLDGSDYITRDISHKLRTSYAISNEIKETYGAAFIHSDFKNKDFEYKTIDGFTYKKYNSFELANAIIMPRVDRILYKINEIVEKNKINDFLSGGIIITGGGSNLSGIAEAFEKVFKCNVRIGTFNLKNVICADEILLNKSYVTAISSLMYYKTNLLSYYNEKFFQSNSIISKILKWIEEIF